MKMELPLQKEYTYICCALTIETSLIKVGNI